ncbi:MAG: ParB/RepB/Spo0J family partition protein [Faecalibacterium sp.]|nr:ParB/RepB/Spo0J family partition protein [Ruminococcus sp.]MCM1486639.1 ParB/RepB/Spo0J family partition protein [Faecalibacterium sp.]
MSKNHDSVTDIPLSEISDFPNHPYQVRDDESMLELVESIKERGLIQPVLVRPIENGMYEMVSGHRRKRAFELAEIETIPARVKELSRDEAILAMVDSNLQREEILPSEKAKAYKMRLDAMKRQGQRTDLTLRPVGTKLRTDEELAEEVGDSARQIRRYIRLNELVPEILALVDEGRIAMRPAVEISYFPKETQQQLFEAIEYNDCTPSHDQAIRMRKALNEGRLTKEVVDAIMDEEKPNQREKSPFRDNRIGKLIPKSIPPDKQCDYVLRALDFYNKYRQKKREQAR